MIFAAFSPMESKLHGVSCRLDLSSFASVQAFATDLGILGRPVELLVCALPEVWSHLLVRPTETYGRLKLFETSYEMSFKEVETPERHRRNSRAKGIYMSIHMQDSMFSAR